MVKGESEMSKIVAYLLFILGLLLTLMSIFYEQTIKAFVGLSLTFNEQMIMAFVGLGLTFWGGLLLYITPSKHVPLELLTASTTSILANIEKIIADSNLTGKGIYLPPKYLKDFESSLVFIPSRADQSLPIGTYEAKLYSGSPGGIFLTPPGMALSKLFERELGTTFARTDLNYVQSNLPKVLIEDLEIADNIDVKTENNIVTIEVKNHIFSEVCQETRKLPRIHESVGCILCSGIACALAKATGKQVIIEKEEQKGRTTKIQYRMLEA
jgi:hypothetical protein